MISPLTKLKRFIETVRLLRYIVYLCKVPKFPILRASTLFHIDRENSRGCTRHLTIHLGKEEHVILVGRGYSPIHQKISLDLLQSSVVGRSSNL